MSSKKTKKKGPETPPKPEEDKPTKQDYAIANYLKKNVPTKRTKFLHHQVNYFYASKAVDVLLDSTWASGKEVLFTDRQSVVDYCNRLLAYKFFHRARKIPITDKDLKPKDLKKKREREEKLKREKDKKKKKKNDKKEETDDTKKEEEQSEEDKDDRKKKKKIKLDMHLEQVFVDGLDAYVWIYDPVPFWYYIAGGLCLLAAVGVCLFPLWPPSVRQGVYYISVAGAGFLGAILGLAVLRFIIFSIIWLLSMGRHHFWIVPNLTEDVGFFASFWPLYHYEYRGADYDHKKARKKKKVVLKTTEEEGNDKQQNKDAPDTAGDTDRHETDGERDGEGRTETEDQEDEESDEQQSQAFEMVEKDDLDDSRASDEEGENSGSGEDGKEEACETEDKK